MIARHRIDIDMDQLADLCRRYHVRELALFGSVLRDDFRDDSDVDMLVEFEPDAPVDLLEFIHLKNELSVLLGRDVDLVEKPGLKRFVRDEVMSTSRVVYAIS